MRFIVEEQLSEEESDEASRNLLKQSIGAQMRLTLTESVFLVGLAVALGASNMVIGVLAAIPFIARIVQIPSVYLSEKYESRKQICFHTQLANRLAILLLIVVPLLPISEANFFLLILAVLVQAIFVSVGAPSWNSWLKDLVPERRMGQFFSGRMTVNGIVATLSLVLGAAVLSLWPLANLGPVHAGYMVVYSAAMIAGLVSVRYTLSTPEPRAMRKPQGTTMRDLLRNPFRNRNFRNLLIFSGIWVFATSMSAPFFTVYLLKRLDLGIAIASALAALTQIMSMMFFRSRDACRTN